MTKQEQFINTIAPIIQKYAKEYGYKVVSPIIAQCCLESAWGNSALAKAPNFNFFGMKAGDDWKGGRVRMKTKEEYIKGILQTIHADFRTYPDLESGIEGYFVFIQYPRYKNLKTATTPEQYLLMIKNDGYATSSGYVNNNMNVVEKYNLRQYDSPPDIREVDYFVKITAKPSLFLRSSYSTASIPVLPKGLPEGMILKITHECEGWGKVGDIEGWVSLEYTKKI